MLKSQRGVNLGQESARWDEIKRERVQNTPKRFMERNREQLDPDKQWTPLKEVAEPKKTSNYESDSDDSIYTSNIVDGNIVYSAIELKQKLQAYEAPSDPKDWCKGFHIEIPFLDLRIEPTPPSKPEGNGVSAKLVSEEFKSPED